MRGTFRSGWHCTRSKSRRPGLSGGGPFVTGSTVHGLSQGGRGLSGGGPFVSGGTVHGPSQGDRVCFEEDLLFQVALYTVIQLSQGDLVCLEGGPFVSGGTVHGDSAKSRRPGLS